MSAGLAIVPSRPVGSATLLCDSEAKALTAYQALAS